MKGVLPWLVPESHIKRSRPCATACPACWAMGTNELKQCPVRKNILYWADKNSLRQDNEQIKAGPLSFVLFESIFGPGSTFSGGHPSLVSLVCSQGLSCQYKRILSRLGCSNQPGTKHFFPHRTLFHFICPHRSATWAGSRAWSPVS